MPTRVYLSFALSYTINGIIEDQVWIEATYTVSLVKGGTYGPVIQYTLDLNQTLFGVVGDPNQHTWPSPGYIIGTELPVFAFVEGGPSMNWSVCFDSDMTPFLSGISDGTIDNQRNLVRDFANAQGPYHRRQWSELTIGENLFFQTLFGAGSSVIDEPWSICLGDVTPPGGSPYEPLFPPLEWDDWPEPSTTPPPLPETPFVPPEDGPEWDIEHEAPEDDLPEEEFEDHFESAIARWKVRLGLPDHDVVFATGAASVELDVLNFDFQVGSINVPITIDFDQWRPQLSLFGLLLNAAAVVWVICGVYDAIRRA